MIVWMLMVGCQMMDNPGTMFAPVTIQETQVQQIATEKSVVQEVEMDPLFQDPQEEIALHSDTENSTSPEQENLHKTDDENIVEVENHSLHDSDSGFASQQEETPDLMAPTKATDNFRPALVKDGWRPTLIGSMMKGPTPMAVLAMPGGEKVVVEAGQLLEKQGVVVMAVGANYVELAVIQGSEGRASIENLTLTAQF